MSWSITLLGKTGTIKNAVDNDPHMPEVIKAVIKSHLDESSNYSNGYLVEGYGHLCTGDGSATSNFKLEVKAVQILE